MPRTALIAGLIVSLGACTSPKKPKVNKEFDEAAQRWKAAQSVDAGINKEKAPAGTTVHRPTSGTQHLKTGETIWLQQGKSRVLQLPYKVTRVSIGNPDLAGVVVLGANTILVNAKELPKGMNEGGAQTRTSRSGLLSSRTFTPPPQIEETTVILWDGKNNTDAHTIYVSDFTSEQVLLEVTVAELNRTAMEERGVDFQKVSGAVRAGYWLGGGEQLGFTQFLPGGSPTDPTLPPPFSFVTGPTRPTFAFQNGDSNITALVTMLQTEGLATVLAQPKILALSGQNAVFQVGGEIPIRIVTSFSAEIEFKAFGTLVNFLPRISDDGDIILTVTPEVSRPDFTQQVEGVPSFITRRASTTARLKEGESLVLGGLTQNTRTETERGIPYLKDLPYAGNLFRQTSYSNTVTELMVIATPHLVKTIPAGTEFDTPADHGPMTRDEAKTQPDAAKVTRPRLPTPAYNSRKRSPTKE